MNLLLVGFESMDPAAGSNSWKCVSACEGIEFEDHRVQVLQLPASWDDCFEPLESALEENWDAVVCLADKSCDSYAIERIAINEADVTWKDRLGRRPRRKLIKLSGDPGYWTGLPYRELALRLTTANFQASPSHSAGMGLANYVFYRMMHELATRGEDMQAGLIQIPDSAASLSEERTRQFVSVLLDTLDPAARSQDSLSFDSSRVGSHLRERLKDKADWL
ncbi:pyrrolidone-carboxylate peptidase superfamily [Verrucomicrobiia bacterium DG1235]|nr:pyrrolidone-carboxylate peptidase superfamily [Verrucomicrobiae bacterium DG1235]